MEAKEADVERFCHEAWPRLVAALTNQFGDRWLAEDLAQEALVRACERWSSVRRLDSPIGWTFRVGVNLSRSSLRRRAAERPRVPTGATRPSTTIPASPSGWRCAERWRD